MRPSDIGNDFLADQLSLGIHNAMAQNPAMLVSLVLDASQATIKTVLSTGRVHVPEYSNNLKFWSVMETKVPLTAEFSFADAGGTGRPSPSLVPTRFYRVLRKGLRRIVRSLQIPSRSGQRWHPLVDVFIRKAAGGRPGVGRRLVHG
jgi:hypothetical protein